MGFDRFVGIPYADKGRDPATGVDCWGLVALVMRELRGVDLPSYAEHYVTAADRAAMATLIAGRLDAWSMIVAGQEQSFDSVLMREGRFPRHIGIVTSPGRLLHVSEGMTRRIERYRATPLANRVVGFYRFRNQ